MPCCRSRRNRGQIAVVVTLAIPVLLAAMALCTDVMAMYLNWQALQKAADAAALAGAHFLPSNGPDYADFPTPDPSCNYSSGDPDYQAEMAACTYVVRNTVQAKEIESIAFEPDSTNPTRIKVSVHRAVPAYFARVLGRDSFEVAAAATAQLQPVGTVQGILPIGLDYATNFSYGQTATLHNVQVGPGNWDALALGSTGSQQYRDNLDYGYDGPINVGDNTQPEPGVSAGPTDQGISARLSRAQSEYPNGTFQSHTLDDPRAVVLPTVDWSGCNGRCSTLAVKGFVEVWINSINGWDVNVTFIGGAVRGEAKASITDTGTYHVALVQ